MENDVGASFGWTVVDVIGEPELMLPLLYVELLLSSNAQVKPLG